MSDGAKKVNPDGRRLQHDGKKVVCGCCGSCQTFYAAQFCNTGCCPEWNYRAYICADFQCDGEPLENGQVIRGEVDGKVYCFVISTGTIYCADPAPEGCEPLPKGAPILIPSTVECIDDCGPVNCPPRPCYYVGSLCSCSPNLPPGAGIWVKCEAWHEAQALGPCPVWGIAIGGIGYCIYVREGGIPTELPDPLPPNSIVIDSGGGAVSNCCECCGQATNACCYVDFIDYTTTWGGGCVVSTTYGGHSFCCGETGSWSVHISGSMLTEQVGPFGLCPVTLYTWDATVSPGTSGALASYHYIQYTGDCSGIAFEGDGDFYVNRCGWVWGPIGPPGGCQGGCGTQSGSLHASCSGGSASVVVDNTPCGGQKTTYMASYSVSASDGVCGNNGCGPLGEAVAAPALTTVPAPHAMKYGRRGCSGCRRRRA